MIAITEGKLCWESSLDGSTGMSCHSSESECHDHDKLHGLQLSPQRKESITNAQRHQAHLLLQANADFTSELVNARQQILDEMQQAIAAEATGPQLLPSRVLMLSDHVCPRLLSHSFGGISTSILVMQVSHTMQVPCK